MPIITAAVLDRCGDNPRPYAQNRPLRLATLTLDPQRRGELLVRIHAAGLCHSDLSVVNGDRPRPMPMAIGHEATGIVEALGDPDDAGVAIGDRMILAFLPACGECVRCRSGETYLCAAGAAANGRGELLGGGCRLHEGERAVNHHPGLSDFATHALVDRRPAVKVDRDLPPEIAVLFGCAVLTGVGAVMNWAAVRPGEGVIVYGLGGVGPAALLGARASGATPMLAIDPVEPKRAIAVDLGAEAVAPDDAAAAIERLFPSGAPMSSSRRPARRRCCNPPIARRGGRVVTVGLPNPAETFAVPVSLVADGKR